MNKSESRADAAPAAAPPSARRRRAEHDTSIIRWELKMAGWFMLGAAVVGGIAGAAGGMKFFGGIATLIGAVAGAVVGGIVGLFIYFSGTTLDFFG